MTEKERDLFNKIKAWVVQTSTVTNPYKRYWSASVTLHMDINGTGDTIEKAYLSLTKLIYTSPYYKTLIIEKLKTT